MDNKSFKYKWYTKADIDALFGLLFDGFSKVIAAVGIMIFGFGMPSEIVLFRILPGLGIATFFGNIWYAFEAYKLAKKEKRQDVTAQPYGVGAGQVFGWLFLIMGPVYWNTQDAVLAWQVGIAAGFIGGVIEIIGAFVGKKIIKYTPTAALLGNLSAGAIIWLSLVGMLDIFDKPLIALLPLLIIFMCYIAKVKMPFGLSAGAVAILIGTILAWVTGEMDANQISVATADIKLTAPVFSVGDIIIGMREIVKYLPIVLPLQIANFLTTLQGIESASVAGDKYPVRSSMIMDGLGTIIGSIFGNPFPTTVYYGHPGWKEIGARAGYSVGNAFVYLILCFTGAVGIITALIPYQVVMGMLVFIGIAVTAQAFSESPKKHIPAILIAFFPLIAQYIQTGVEAGLSVAGTSLEKVALADFSAAGFSIKGVLALSQGAFLSSLLLAALMAYLIDHNFKMSSIFAGICCFSAFIGLIHAPKLALPSLEGIPIAIVYGVFGLICLFLYFKNK